MSTGLIILLVLMLLIMFGAGQRILDRLRLTDTWALIIMLAIVVGLIIPTIRIGNYFEFSIGGFLIPMGLCIYLLIRAGLRDNIRALIGVIVTAGIIIGLEYLLPADKEVVIDEVFIYGVVAGLVAYLLGRSRRNAFVCAVFGIALARLVQFIINWSSGAKTVLSLSSAGVFDTMIIAILLAVGLCELLGESLERLCGEKTKERRAFKDGRFVEKKPGENTVISEKSTAKDGK